MNYLHHIRSAWDRITLGDPRLHVDTETVRLLQLRIPRYSQEDRDIITTSMNERALFRYVTDPHLRASLLTRILGLPYTIPSLYSFSEDTKYLQACAPVFKRIVSNNFDKSFKAELTKRYNGSGRGEDQIPLETGEQSFTFGHGSEEEAFEAGYAQLWLFAMRHFPELGGSPLRKDPGHQRPVSKPTAEYLWHWLGHLASHLGFHSAEINLLCQEDPDMKMSIAFLKHARPQVFNATDNCQAKIKAVYEILQSIPSTSLPPDQPVMSINNGCGIEQRCGRPHESTHYADKDLLFYGNVAKDVESAISTWPTSFLFKRDNLSLVLWASRI